MKGKRWYFIGGRKEEVLAKVKKNTRSKERGDQREQSTKSKHQRRREQKAHSSRRESKTVKEVRAQAGTSFIFFLMNAFGPIALFHGFIFS